MEPELTPEYTDPSLQLDHALQVVNPKLWLAFFALFLLLASFFLWAFFGSIPIQVSGNGILMNDQLKAYFPIDKGQEISEKQKVRIEWIPSKKIVYGEVEQVVSRFLSEEEVSKEISNQGLAKFLLGSNSAVVMVVIRLEENSSLENLAKIYVVVHEMRPIEWVFPAWRL